MQRLSLVAVAAVALAALTGCPPSYPNCKDDSTCTEKGEVCVQGQCRECAADANCKEGFRCLDNRCQPATPACTDDGACGAGNICEAGKCAPAQCQGETGCGADSHCQTGRCVAGRAPGTCAAATDCGEGQTCEAGKCVAATDTCDWTPVAFDFNEASLNADAQERLRGLATCMKSGTGTLTLEGHADERGTEEYNLQLSNRRANAVKRYLRDLGVPDNRLETVGYGENRPLNTANSEEAWTQNRRVEFRR